MVTVVCASTPGCPGELRVEVPVLGQEFLAEWECPRCGVAQTDIVRVDP
jgi:hypothetical protein